MEKEEDHDGDPEEDRGHVEDPTKNVTKHRRHLVFAPGARKPKFTRQAGEASTQGFVESIA
jgi:hypothetical protein